jgi:glycosyltransferase involved in cell wall biosynthesis
LDQTANLGPRTCEPREPSATSGSPLGRRIRVARVIARLNVGGPARHVILLTAGLDRRRFDTTLIVGTPEPREGDLLGEARARGVDPRIIPELGRAIRPHRDLVALAKLVRIFRHLRPDIVHTHTAKAGTLGRLAAFLAGVPVAIHTFHGHVLEGYFSAPLARLFLAIERALAKRTDRIIVVSPRLKAAILAKGIGSAATVEVVPLGLELARFAGTRPPGANLRATLGIPPEAPLLAIVGRLVPIKDHATLFQALRLLCLEGLSPHLLVVGDGELRPELERLAAGLGLDACIHFLGWRDDLEAIFATVNVVICSSRNEGTPVALIEAMAAGVPVLSTDVGGVGDLIVHGETGWLVPPGDPPAMAEAVRSILAGPARSRQVAAAGCAAVLAWHGAEGLIHRMEELYTRVLAEKQSQ